MYPLKPLKVLFTNYFPFSTLFCKPFPTLKITNKCAYPGISNEIFGIIAKDLNIEIVPINIVNGDTNRDSILEALGNPDDPYHFMFNKTIDLFSTPFLMDDQKLKKFEFTDRLYEIEHYIYVRHEDLIGQNIWSMFRVYDLVSWEIILVLLLLQCIFVWIVKFMELKCGIKCNSNLDVVWTMIRLQCYQPKPIKFYFYSGNISTYIFSLLQCSIIFGIFASYMLSSMLFPFKDNYLRSPKHLINEIRQGRSEIIVQNQDTWLELQVQNRNDFPFRELREAAKGRPFGNFETFEELIYKVKHQNALAVLASDDKSNYLIQQHCDIVRSDFTFEPKHERLMLLKGHPMTKMLSEAITRNRKKIENVYRRYTNYQKSMGTICEDYTFGDAMKLHSYLGLVFICLGVCVFAVVVLVIERIIHYLFSQSEYTEKALPLHNEFIKNVVIIKNAQ